MTSSSKERSTEAFWPGLCAHWHLQQKKLLLPPLHKARSADHVCEVRTYPQDVNDISEMARPCVS